MAISHGHPALVSLQLVWLRPPVQRPTFRVTEQLLPVAFVSQFKKALGLLLPPEHTRSQCEGPANPDHRHSLQPKSLIQDGKKQAQWDH